MTSKDLYIKKKLKQIQDLESTIGLMQDVIDLLFILYFLRVCDKK